MMTNLQDLYKICYQSPANKWQSCNLMGTKWSLDYGLKETTRPIINNSLIYTFDTYNNANKFMETHYHRLGGLTFVMLKGVGDVVDVPATCATVYLAKLNEYIEKFWLNDRHTIQEVSEREGYTVISAPVGTVMCHWFRPEQLIKTYTINNKSCSNRDGGKIDHEKTGNYPSH